jgi:hypothetical protein
MESPPFFPEVLDLKAAPSEPEPGAQSEPVVAPSPEEVELALVVSGQVMVLSRPLRDQFFTNMLETAMNHLRDEFEERIANLVMMVYGDPNAEPRVPIPDDPAQASLVRLVNQNVDLMMEIEELEARRGMNGLDIE